MDTRPVMPTTTVPSDKLARQTQQMDKAIRTAQIGAGKLNILKIANKLKFGTYNERPQKSTEVNKMITSFEMNGRQWFKEENALAIVIKSNRIRNLEDLQGEWDDADDLNEVKFVDEDVLLMASGQHRVAALRKMGEGYIGEKTALEKRSTRLAQSANPSEDDVEEHDAIRARLAVVLGELETLGTWSVKLYNQDVIDKEKLGGHLSQNQTLHVYGETQEEKLISKLRDLKEILDGEGGMDAFVEALQVETERVYWPWDPTIGTAAS
ncbi:hypothetical protein EDB19DRAFT_1918386 [Suillus lakei]|nr:hypothetical protein EDB19DRAFT_1923198 [Suillus lakei]KAG1719938.1 hypothetical protein EDB19DRAFT_1918386 [Suillus lakei]